MKSNQTVNLALLPFKKVLTLLNKMAAKEGHLIGYAQMPSSSSYWLRDDKVCPVQHVIERRIWLV